MSLKLQLPGQIARAGPGDVRAALLLILIFRITIRTSGAFF